MIKEESEIAQEEALPEAFRVFMESQAFKQAIQPGGNSKFPAHLDAVKEAYKMLQRMK